MKYFAPDQVPRLESATLNPTVLAFALAITIGTGMLFGLAPALALARTELSNTSKKTPAAFSEVPTAIAGVPPSSSSRLPWP